MNISNKCGKHPNNEIFIKMEFPYPGKKGSTIVDSICKECFIEEIKESICKCEDKKLPVDGIVNKGFDIVEELGNINDFDPTKPVMQRDGSKARIIFTDSKHFHKDIIQPICALITINPSDESDELQEIAEFFYENGRFLNIDADDENDLINIEE